MTAKGPVSAMACLNSTAPLLAVQPRQRGPLPEHSVKGEALVLTTTVVVYVIALWKPLPRE
jgi:hypothetical protein